MPFLVWIALFNSSDVLVPVPYESWRLLRTPADSVCLSKKKGQPKLPLVVLVLGLEPEGDAQLDAVNRRQLCDFRCWDER